MKKYDALMKYVSGKPKPAPKPAPGKGSLEELLKNKSGKGVPASLRKPVVKPVPVSKSAGWEGMSNMSATQKAAEMRKAGVDEATIKKVLGK